MNKKYLFMIIAALLIVLIMYQLQSVKRMYQAAVSKRLNNTGSSNNSIITNDDIKHLPESVQKYLHYTGVIGKPRVSNVMTVFEGELKMDPKQDWTKVKIRQYNFYDQPARFSYIRGNISGIPIVGLDSYDNGRGGMLIKLGSLINVVDAKGMEMDMSAMVTFFADMCFTPAALLDSRIQWETIDPLTVKATFVDKGSQVSGVLYFNDKGELIKFVTDDRYYSPTGKTYQKIKWTARGRNYKEFHGIKVLTDEEAIWHFAEGDYVYGKIHVKEIEYNCEQFN